MTKLYDPPTESPSPRPDYKNYDYEKEMKAEEEFIERQL